MKKRSKLFLLVSGILFTLGVIVCLIGAGVSSTTGEQIYSSKIGDGRGYVYDFGDGEIDKIKIKVTDANVNIYGSSEKTYMEVINFNENLCSYTGNNAIVTFKETVKVEDITGFWENGLSFKGLRYILRPVSADKEKIVNIYISQADHIKAFDISVETGTVTISSLNTVTDYHVNMASGKIFFTNVITESGINIKATGETSADIDFNRVNTDIVVINAKRASFTAEGFSFDSCEMNVMNGSASFAFVSKNQIYDMDITTKGKLMVDGEVYPDRFTYHPEDASQTDDPDGESEEDRSYLKISGDDFSVAVTTPVPAEIPEETIQE